MSRRRRERNRFKKIMRVFAYGCWLAAAAVIIYPLINSWLFEKNANNQYEEYNNHMTDQSWEEELEAAREYNLLLSEKGSFYYDAFDEQISAEEEHYRSLLNADEEGLMGYISIPEISVHLPIYHGTDESVLEKGCGHMEGSSLPIGGKSTHAVLCAHTGLGKAELFTNLDQLVTGDKFSISIFGLELEYQVEEINVVLPQEMEGLYISENEDIVTLITCTPYGINSHRLLVRGKRIELQE